MAEVSFEPRYALAVMKNPDLEVVRGIILHPHRPGEEFGEVLIEYREGGRQVSLIAISDRTFGYYLKYFDAERSEWLSLGDTSRLTEVVCPDDWEASAGLFVSPELAWSAVRDFCQTGTRSNALTWIRPEEMPEGGNW